MSYPQPSILRTLILCFAALVFAAGLPAAVAASGMIPDPPKIRAKGYLLMDFNSGKMLVEKDIDSRMEPASLTKMMSSYVVAYELARGTIGYDDKVLISEKAWRMKGSKMFIEVGKRVKVKELIKGVIIQSGNDATIALAEHVAGSEQAFVDLMNQHAERLNMLGTHFANATGWPHKDHFSTPRDLATLAAALIRDFPDHYKLYSIRSYTYNKIKQPNRNRLLGRDERVDGVKTGHTDSAGYCLVASAKEEGMRLLSVVLGTRSESARAAESQKLLNYGFRFFETRRIYSANETISELPLWKGAKETLAVGLQSDLWVTFPRGQFEELETDLQVAKHLKAPTTTGQALGDMVVKIGDDEYARQELVALEDVESGGFFGNLVDEVKLMLD